MSHSQVNYSDLLLLVEDWLDMHKYYTLFGLTKATKGVIP